MVIMLKESQYWISKFWYIVCRENILFGYCEPLVTFLSSTDTFILCVPLFNDAYFNIHIWFISIEIIVSSIIHAYNLS